MDEGPTSICSEFRWQFKRFLAPSSVAPPAYFLARPQISALRRHAFAPRSFRDGITANLNQAANRIFPSIVPLIHFLFETGCRKGEALAAEWTWVDLERRMLRIPATRFWRPKDGEAREVPLSDALVAMLRERPRPTSWVFPRSRTNKHSLGQYQTFPEKLWRKITGEAKVLGGPHTTRHTFASHFLAARPDLSLLAKVMGHSTTYVTELYTHLLPDHLAQARNAVQLAPPCPSWANSKPKPKTLAREPKSSIKSILRH